MKSVELKLESGDPFARLVATWKSDDQKTQLVQVQIPESLHPMEIAVLLHGFAQQIDRHSAKNP